MVSVISAGLANFLGLVKEDLSNVHPSPFTVQAYNGSRSYMPLITTILHLGARGGDERIVSVQLCVLDTNRYKLLLGVDVLGPLGFIYDDP